MNRCAVVVCGLVIQAWLVAAAEPADPGPDSDAVRRQTAKIERLQQELRRAQEELDRLQKADGEVQSGDSSATAKTGSDVDGLQVQRSTGVDVGALPALEAGEVLTAADLLRHYELDAEATDKRYRGETIQVRGTIHGFHRPLARRVYDLRFESPIQTLEVVCRFSYVDQYRTVYADENDRVLLAKTLDRSTRQLYRRGDVVTVRGRCQGVRGGVVRLSDCQRVD